MTDSSGQHVGAAVAAYLDVRVGFCLGPNSTRHTLPPLPEVSR